MQEYLTSHEIEIAAVTNRMTMRDVCKLAGVSYVTFWRWKKNPDHPITHVAVKRLSLVAQGQSIETGEVS